MVQRQDGPLLGLRQASAGAGHRIRPQLPGGRGARSVPYAGGGYCRGRADRARLRRALSRGARSRRGVLRLGYGLGPLRRGSWRGPLNHRVQGTLAGEPYGDADEVPVHGLIAGLIIETGEVEVGSPPRGLEVAGRAVGVQNRGVGYRVGVTAPVRLAAFYLHDQLARTPVDEVVRQRIVDSRCSFAVEFPFYRCAHQEIAIEIGVERQALHHELDLVV